MTVAFLVKIYTHLRQQIYHIGISRYITCNAHITFASANISHRHQPIYHVQRTYYICVSKYITSASADISRSTYISHLRQQIYRIGISRYITCNAHITFASANISHRHQPIYFCPWHSWIARQTPTLKVEGSNPFGQAKKKSRASGFFFLYSW